MRLTHTLKCNIPYLASDKLEGELISYCIDLTNDTQNKWSYPHTPNKRSYPHTILFMLKRNPIAHSYKWGTIGKFHSYKDSYQHAEYGIIVGMTGANTQRYRVYLPTTDRVVIRSKPRAIIEEPPKDWGFPIRNISKIQLRADNKRKLFDKNNHP